MYAAQQLDNQMDIEAIIKQLREELAGINESILALERLEIGRGRRRGRPPAWLAEAKSIAPAKRRGRPPGRKNKASSENK